MNRPSMPAAVLLLSAPFLLFACSGSVKTPASASQHSDVAGLHLPGGSRTHINSLSLPRKPSTAATRIVSRAKAEVQRGVLYDASYVHLRYPGGDVPADRGACTDVVVRALRSAGYDLQRLIHEDELRSPRSYPRPGAEKWPNSDIDHRRVPYHMVFLRRHGIVLPLDTAGAARGTWLPGDLVYWQLNSSQNHCGVLSDVRNPDGLPFVIHNLSQAAEQDCLTAWKIIGHFRYPSTSHTG